MPTSSITISQIAGDDILNAIEAGSTLTISGTTTNVADGDIVSVLFNSNTYTATVAGDAWSLGVPPSDLTTSVLPDGPYPVQATVTDSTNGTATDTRNLTVDEVAPPAPSTPDLRPGSDSGSSAADNITSVTLPTFTGTGVDGDTVNLLNNGTVIGTGTVSGGTWSITATTSLVEGSNPITAQQIDVAGSVSSPSSALTVTLDTTPPAVNVALLNDTGALPNDLVTQDDVLQGTGDDNATVTLIENGNTLGTTTANPLGAWTFNPNPSLEDGRHTITASETDTAGNIGSNAITFTLDTTPPPAPGALDLVFDNGASSTDDITNIGSATFSGTGEDGDTVTLLDGNTPIGSGIVSNGTWSITATTSLVEGSNDITATETDVAGNISSASGTLAVTLDTMPPLPPSTPILTTSSDSGVSGTDDITNIGLATFSGTGESGDTVTLLDGNTTIGTGIVSNGTWSITASTALTEGSNNITATQTDVAGNISSTSGTLVVTLDTLPPPPPSTPVLTASSDSGVSNTDDITNVVFPTLTGTGEEGDTVTLLDDGILIGSGTVATGGAWSIAATTALAEGSNHITATQTDVAGNTSGASSPLVVTLDTTPPPAPGTLDLVSDTGASSTDDITNVDLSTFTGSGEDGDTVTLLDGNTPIGTGIVSNGTWSITATTPLTGGGNDITATQTDVAGNISNASSLLTVTLDTVPPAVTVALADHTGASPNDNVTSDPKLIGTGDPDTVVTITQGASLLGTTTADSTGIWTFTPTILADGSHTITVSETDIAGNTGTTAITFTLDTTAPAAPSALSLVSDTGASTTDDITNIPLSTFSGTGESGATVTLFDGTTAIGTGTVSNGTWSIAATTALIEGANTITATQTDAAGNISIASSALRVTLDTMAPLAPSTPDLLALSDTGVSDTDNITNDTLPIFSGTGESGATVTLLDGITTIGTGTVTDGTWSVLATTPLIEGQNSITAELTDVAGNISDPSGALDVTLDTTAPAVTAALANDTGALSNDSVTNDPTLQGTGDPDTMVTLTEGATLVGTTTADGSGAWTYTPVLSDGPHTITASERDIAGNTGTVSTTFTLDTKAPVVTAALADDTGASPTDSVTKDIALHGTGDANAVVTLTEGAVLLGTTTADGTGAWAYTPALLDGPHTVTASETDAAGNTGTASVAFTLDTTAPAAPGTPILTSDSGASSTDDITNVRLSTFSGSGENGATVSLLDGSTVIGTGTVTTGTWSISATTPLSEGANAITAIQTDVAGNISPASNALNVTLDTVAPAAPSTPDLLALTDTGVSDTDNITANAQPIFSGIGENGATVILLDGTTTVGTAKVSGGTWSITPATPLSQGVNRITAKQIDVAGNISIASSPLNVSIDYTPPAVTVALTNDTGASTTDLITNNATLHGTGDANAVVTLTDGTTPLGTTTANAAGAWTYTPTLSDGPHTINASETDIAGNTGTTSIAFTLDTMPPAAPSTLHLVSDSGSSNTDNITDVRRSTFSGTGENGATVTLLDGGTAIGTGTVTPQGTWSITATTPLTPGNNSITATQTDVAGNISLASSPLIVNLDTVAPVVTAALVHDTGASSTDSLTSDDRLRGTGDANAVVTLTEGGFLLGTTVANGSGAWSFAPSLPDGTHTITASETDTAGNTGTKSIVFTLETAAPAPSAPVLAAASDSGDSDADDITNIALPIFSGTGEIGANVNLFDDTTTIGTGTVAANGTWSITATTALSEGNNSITAQQTDLAGITSALSDPVVVTLDTTAPTVTEVTASPSDAALQPGESATFTLGFSEAVTVDTTTGEPTLTLSDGATATYVSGSGSDALTFSYSVADGQATPDLAVTGVDLNGSTITDAAGNAADLTGAAVNPPGTLTIAGVAPVAEFDAAYYLANNPDVAAAGVDPAEHYATIGWKEGRNPDAFFNTDYYLNQNPDVAAAGIDPLTHYETIGWKEGRDPSVDFSTDAYLQANPDVAAAGIDPLMHYLEYGAPEGRMAFIAQPHGVGPQNPLVDNAYYFANNPDVAAAGVNPFTQYDSSGWHEGRNPDALFNTNYYLQQNPDVAAAGVDPLLHYEQFGWLEGRNPSPDFSTNAYLNANPDVKAAGVNPLVQYEEFGINEGRAIFHV